MMNIPEIQLSSEYRYGWTMVLCHIYTFTTLLIHYYYFIWINDQNYSLNVRSVKDDLQWNYNMKIVETILCVILWHYIIHDSVTHVRNKFLALHYRAIIIIGKMYQFFYGLATWYWNVLSMENVKIHIHILLRCVCSLPTDIVSLRFESEIPNVRSNNSIR